MRTINMTPTWRGLLPALLHLLEHGSYEARQTAREEMARMAQAADNWNKSLAKQGFNTKMLFDKKKIVP